MNKEPTRAFLDHAKKHTLMFGPDRMAELGELLGFVEILNTEPGRYLLEDIMSEMSRLLGKQISKGLSTEELALYRAYHTICTKWGKRVIKWYKDSKEIKRRLNK